jgi:hypothetical protein
MSTFAHDMTCAVRTLRTAPSFAAIAIATLAIATLAVGIGANTAIVSVIDNLLFRPPDGARRELGRRARDGDSRDAPIGALGVALGLLDRSR